MFKRLEPADFKKALNSEDHTLLDLRTREEQEIFGIISTCQKHIDVYKEDALEKIKKLPREGKYLIYCYHGVRSEQIGNLMHQLGFEKVYDLIGGIDKFSSM